MGRYDILHRIQQLNPVQDHCQIYHLMYGYEFPWDTMRSLENARFYSHLGNSQVSLQTHRCGAIPVATIYRSWGHRRYLRNVLR